MSDEAIEHRRFPRALHKLDKRARQTPSKPQQLRAQGSETESCIALHAIGTAGGVYDTIRTTLPMATTVRKDEPRRLGRSSSAEGSSSASSAVPCRVVSASSASSSIASIDRSVRSAGRVRRRRAGRMERPDRRRASQPPARVTARSARETENMRSAVWTNDERCCQGRRLF